MLEGGGRGTEDEEVFRHLRDGGGGRSLAGEEERDERKEGTNLVALDIELRNRTLQLERPLRRLLKLRLLKLVRLGKEAEALCPSRPLSN